MNSRPPNSFGVFGHYGNENMGDEAIVAAVIEELRTRYPDSQIYGFSMSPEDTLRRHGLESFPIRQRRQTPVSTASSSSSSSEPNSGSGSVGMRQAIKRIPVIYPLAKALVNFLRSCRTAIAEIAFLWKSYRCLRQIDVLLISGSGQLTDESGIWGFPYTLYKWSLLCKLAGCKLVFLSVGAGPLDKSLSRWFIKRALRRAVYRSYRDQSSYRLVNALGVGADDPVCPDLAWGKKIAELKIAVSSGRALRVGVNPMAYHDPRYWPDANKTLAEEYLKKLTSIFIWIARQGHIVVLFPTQLRADVLVIRELVSVLDRTCEPEIRKRIEVAEVTGVESQLSVMSSFDLIIATRFHGVLMSYLVGKPTIGISYHPKIDDLMASMGHRECSLPIEPLDVDAVERTFFQLVSRLDESRKIVLAKRAEQQRALTEMYDRAFATITELL
jgi:polysaccharide pyruvyl transferase WcaK-like protein